MDLSMTSILSGLVIGSIGLFLFMWGKRTDKPIYYGIGLAMCVYPYFISNQLIVWLLTGLLLIPVWTFRHA